jgi:hypothetical protein
MPLTFRLHGTRDMGGRRSYTVRSGSWIVGSIDEIVEGPSTGTWRYQLTVGAPTDFRGTGISDSLPEAKAHFDAAWQRWLE